MSDCTHETTEARIWVLSNGTKQIVMQCTACGHKTSSAISHSKFTPEQISAMLPLDTELIKRTEEIRLVAQRAKAAAASASFTKKRIEHTKEYHEYLRTPEWRRKADAVLFRDDHTCQGCLGRATEVHHLTYAHIFEELLFELMSVCRSCHAKIHEKDEK